MLYACIFMFVFFMCNLIQYLQCLFGAIAAAGMSWIYLVKEELVQTVFFHHCLMIGQSLAFPRLGIAHVMRGRK